MRYAHVSQKQTVFSPSLHTGLSKSGFERLLVCKAVIDPLDLWMVVMDRVLIGEQLYEAEN
jgi:hypothetical protein